MLREVQELAGGCTVESSLLSLDFPAQAVSVAALSCVLGLGAKVPREGLHLWRSYFRVRPLVLGKHTFPQFPMISWRI